MPNISELGTALQIPETKLKDMLQSDKMKDILETVINQGMWRFVPLLKEHGANTEVMDQFGCMPITNYIIESRYIPCSSVIESLLPIGDSEQVLIAIAKYILHFHRYDYSGEYRRYKAFINAFLPYVTMVTINNFDFVQEAGPNMKMYLNDVCLDTGCFNWFLQQLDRKDGLIAIIFHLIKKTCMISVVPTIHNVSDTELRDLLTEHCQDLQETRPASLHTQAVFQIRASMRSRRREDYDQLYPIIPKMLIPFVRLDTLSDELEKLYTEYWKG